MPPLSAAGHPGTAVSGAVVAVDNSDSKFEVSQGRCCARVSACGSGSTASAVFKGGQVPARGRPTVHNQDWSGEPTEGAKKTVDDLTEVIEDEFGRGSRPSAAQRNGIPVQP